MNVNTVLVLKTLACHNMGNLLLFLVVSALNLVIVLTATTYGVWSKGAGTMSRRDRYMAVGYSPSTNTVWLLGGRLNYKQLISFEPSTQSFTDHGSSI